MRVRVVGCALLASVAACGGGGGEDGGSGGPDSAPPDASHDVARSDVADSSTDAPTDAPTDAQIDIVDGSTDAEGDAPRPPTVTTSVITTEHRYIAGPTGMFGGWGPHLGHLLRRASPDELWLADDACAQTGSVDVCDVYHDRRIDYFRRDDTGWTKIDSLALPTDVQQNTASILLGDVVFSYGIDTSSESLVECTFDLGTHAKGCTPLALAIGTGSNYVGAALTPGGDKVAWLTNVVDGGGGSFDWFVDYGGGWNGPRTGDVGGYNDAAYVNVAFDGDEMILHGQFVSGTGSAWSYFAGVGTTHVSTTDPVAWVMALSPASSSDPVFSTNDVVVDPASGDAHLLARSTSGGVLYYHRPHGGAWSAALWTTPSSLRARFVLTSDGTLHLLYGPSGKGLAMRSAPASARVAGAPVDWSAFAEQSIALPAGYESIQAIYPQASIYQSAPVEGVRLAVVGVARQNEVLFVAIDP